MAGAISRKIGPWRWVGFTRRTPRCEKIKGVVVLIKITFCSLTLRLVCHAQCSDCVTRKGCPFDWDSLAFLLFLLSFEGQAVVILVNQDYRYLIKLTRKDLEC